MSAEEILNACDESVSIVPSFQEGGLANPAVHFFRGLKHRNISAIRHAALVNLFSCNYIFVAVLLFKF
jgi:hypothetical protein